MPSGKLTWLWKITMFNGKIHYKWAISHGYVKSPEGKHIRTTLLHTDGFPYHLVKSLLVGSPHPSEAVTVRMTGSTFSANN